MNKRLFNSNLFIFIMICFSSLSFKAYSQVWGWTQKANYGGGAIYDPFIFSIDQKVYVGTGRSIPNTLHQDFWEYDIQTNVWTQMAPFPGTGRYGAKAFAIGHFGYAGTGWDPGQKSDFYRYDPATNTWMSVPNFAGSSRYTASTLTIDNYGYLGLGYAPMQNDFWKFDPFVNSWTQISDFPGAPRQAACSFTIDHYGYVGLGSDIGNLYNDFYKYDPTNNSWSSIASFPGQPRTAASAFAIDSLGFVVCGYDYVSTSAPFSIFKDFWKYNSINDTWIQLLDFPGTKRFVGSATSADGKGYLGFGSDTVFYTHYLNDFWEYGPLTTAVEEVNEKAWNVYYEYNSHKLNIMCHQDHAKDAIVEIYDLNGVCLFKSPQLHFSERKSEVECPTNLSGIKLVVIKANNKISYCKKIYFD